MDKSEFIKSLQKVKIVIGNGFDLYCGLKTKYSDFFESNYDKYSHIKRLFAGYLNKELGELSFSDKEVEDYNVWDLFFALNRPDKSKNSNRNWCDIERMMLFSFQDIQREKLEQLYLFFASKVQWKTIKEIASNNKVALNHEDAFVSLFVKERIKRLGNASKSFYDFLLSELKTFEKNFGNYIYEQMVPKTPESNFIDTTNKEYFWEVEATINELCDINNLVSIDTFNYSDMCIENLKCPIQHINGSYLNPIFGIDSSFEPEDECFIFTKTARRIDSDMFNQSFERKPDFENVVIFGHSLNEADYSYFFPLFDKLNLLDSLANNVVVFAYSIYDGKQEQAIKSTLRKSISNILFAYAKSKGVSEPQRFLDSLSTQNRIVTYELPARLNTGIQSF